MSIFSFIGLATKAASGAARVGSKAPSIGTKAIDILKIGRPATTAIQSGARTQQTLAATSKSLAMLQKVPFIKLPSQFTAAAKAVSGAAKAATASKSVASAAKIGLIGGALGGAGLLAGAGIDAAIVKPFKQLGLVTTDKDGKTQLTTIGKTVVIGLLVTVVGGIIVYGVSKAK